MNAYSEDLRKKIVEADEERGMPKTEAAKTFSVGISSVKRYVAAARASRSLAPKKRPGSKTKVDETARRLLESDLEERPAATLAQRREFLRRVAGVRVSDSTVSRMLKRMGWTQKKTGGCERTRRVPEGSLPGDARRHYGSGPLRVRGRVFDEHLAASAVRLGTQRRAGALLGAAQLGTERLTLLASMTLSGMGPSLAVEGANTRVVFEAYVGEVLAPSLRPGQVMVMDNLSAHKGGRVRELIEERDCEVLYLPPYSPDFNPIEQAFSKLKGSLRKIGACTREALIEAMGAALSAVSARDASGFFRHCGYRTAAQLL